jgi:hypothetical protein
MGTIESGVLMYTFSFSSAGDDITVGACLLVVVCLLFSGFVVLGASRDAAEEELGMSFSWGSFDVGAVVIEKSFDGVRVEDADEGVEFASRFFADACERYAHTMLSMRAVISVSCFGEACVRAPAAISSTAWASVRWTVPADVAMEKADGAFVAPILGSWGVC